jgi:3-hydroxyacyl-[acyl-carrier-protein] dehydratase
VTVLSWRTTFCKLRGIATVDGELAAEATLMCKMVDRDLGEPAPATQPVTVESKR